MRFMQIESVLQTINRSEPAKNRFSVALVQGVNDLINFWQISVNIWLNYLPFPMYAL